MDTFELRDGTKVLARYVDGHLRPFQYLAMSQAVKKAESIGGGTVKRLSAGRAYYVVPHKA